MSDQDQGIKNYFNYFTEIEDHFRSVRGTGLFMMSPLDWALVETWKNGDVPLEAVLRGINVSFEKWRSAKRRREMINSVAYCAQAVAQEAQQMAGAAVGSAAQHDTAPPFTVDELRSYLGKNAADLRQGGLDDIAAKLDAIAADIEPHFRDLESLERTLTAYEDKMLAVQRARLTEDELIAARRELDLELKPYRRKMTADQLTMLEKQFLDRRILERAKLPRLSLFYLR